MATPRTKTELNRLKFADLLEAVAELGIMSIACEKVGIDKKTMWRQAQVDSEFAAQLQHAREVGKAKRLEYLEDIAYRMAPTNPTMTMFLLKKLDPSYRESYNVHSSSAPTTYVIDLSLPTGDDTPHDADQSPAMLLE
jgi:hypothetical protein